MRNSGGDIISCKYSHKVKVNLSTLSQNIKTIWYNFNILIGAIDNNNSSPLTLLIEKIVKKNDFAINKSSIRIKGTVIFSFHKEYGY